MRVDCAHGARVCPERGDDSLRGYAPYAELPREVGARRVEMAPTAVPCDCRPLEAVALGTVQSANRPGSRDGVGVKCLGVKCLGQGSG